MATRVTAFLVMPSDLDFRHVKAIALVVLLVMTGCSEDRVICCGPWSHEEIVINVAGKYRVIDRRSNLIGRVGVDQLFDGTRLTSDAVLIESAKCVLCVSKTGVFLNGVQSGFGWYLVDSNGIWKE